MLLHHFLERRTHARCVKPFDRVVEGADAGENQLGCTIELRCGLRDRNRNVQTSIDVDERLDVAQAVINDGNHLNSLLSNPMALSTLAPMPIRKRLFL
ncbi:hypothetical protein D3C79_1009640 [compost metagenome]